MTQRTSTPPLRPCGGSSLPALARLARFVGDLDTAEELAQDTFVAAIEKWRQDGVPDNPAAWLHTTARYQPSTGSEGGTATATRCA